MNKIEITLTTRQTQINDLINTYAGSENLQKVLKRNGVKDYCKIIRGLKTTYKVIDKDGAVYRVVL